MFFKQATSGRVSRDPDNRTKKKEEPLKGSTINPVTQVRRKRLPFIPNKEAGPTKNQGATADKKKKVVLSNFGPSELVPTPRSIRRKKKRLYYTAPSWPQKERKDTFGVP